MVIEHAGLFRRLAAGITKRVGIRVGRDASHVEKACTGETPTFLEMQRRAMDAALSERKPERDVFAELDALLAVYGFERARRGDVTPSLRDLALAMDMTPEKALAPQITQALSEIFERLEAQQSAGRFLRGKGRRNVPA